MAERWEQAASEGHQAKPSSRLYLPAQIWTWLWGFVPGGAHLPLLYVVIFVGLPVRCFLVESHFSEDLWVPSWTTADKAHNLNH